MNDPSNTSKPTEGAESADDGRVWKALADANRRQMLDLLRRRPMTTGALAECFSFTRYAAMKHLDVLTEAGLVLVRRQGRERWNHLNAVPIQRIYQRWIQPFAEASADRLLRLKQVAEKSSRSLGAEAMTAISDRTFRALDIQQEIHIEASRDKVWRALVNDIAQWWPRDFYVGAQPHRFVVEPRVAGRVYEDWGDGQGVLWATVLVYETERRLQWVGDLSADFGGPARSMTSFVLEDDGSATRLKFRDTPYGALSENAGSELDSGWRFLLQDCLKPFAETGQQPQRPESVENNA